jgi:UDP-glucose-4-epimerase GalE
MLQQKNILIIGGAGYIGSHTTLALKDAGYGTVVYDNFSSGHRDVVFGDYFVEGNLGDTEALTKALSTYDIACVVHFAALIEAGQSVLTPLPFFENNVAGTVSLLRAMEAAKVTRLVFSSTAAVYGNRSDASLLAEDIARAPINPYGDSKSMVETILQACVSAHGFHSIALRYFNACGADAQGRTGERHDPETHLIPLVIEAARGQRPHINIYGTDYDTPDGTCIRDYIHVSDLATGHVAAVRHLLGSTEPFFTPINLGTGLGHSVRQIIEAVKSASGVDIKVVETKRRSGDPAMLVANPDLARRVLNWSAQHSTLETIVRDAWAYAERQ